MKKPLQTSRSSKQQQRRLRVETLESRLLLSADWRNPVNAVDVNRDGLVTPLDALIVLNEVGRRTRLGLTELEPRPEGSSLPYYDVDGDGDIVPLDALRVLIGIRPLTQSRYVLKESTAPASELSVTIGLGGDSGTRTYQFDIDAFFDPGSEGFGTEDALAVYLVDPESPETTLLDRGELGTAIFVLSGSRADFTPGMVRFDGRTVSVDLTELQDRTTGQLVFQLISQNDRSDTSITIRPHSNELDLEGSIPPRFASRGQLVAPGESIAIAGLSPASAGQFETELRNIRFNRVTGRYDAELQLINRGGPVGRNVAVAFPGLPEGAELIGAAGTTTDGSPFLSFRPAIPAGGLGTGQRTDSIRVAITTPSLRRFTLATEVWIGEPNRAPIFAPLDPITVRPGQRIDVPLTATDPDGDRVTYSLRTLDGPSMRLGGNGVLSVMPTPSQIGSYSITLIASDGSLTSQRDLQIDVVADPLATTRVSGQVLDVDGTPLQGLQVEVGGVQGLTMNDGRFMLDLGSGPIASDTLRVRGETFSGEAAYPFIAEKLPFMLGREIYSGFDNVINRPIYLPKLNTGQPVNPAANSVIEATLREGHAPVRVDIAAGSLLTQSGTPFTGNLSITEVPVDLTPAALPPNLLPDQVITIQPGEMVFATPAPLTFPNTAGWEPGTVMDLWSINPTTGEFEIVGAMVVSADGTIIETTSGGIRNSSWHFPAPPDPDPEPDDDGDEDNDCEDCKATDGNFEVKSHSGTVLDDHAFVTYQSMGQTQGFALHYDSQRADPRPIIHLKYSNLVPRDNQRLVAGLSFRKDDYEFQLPGYSGGEYGGLRGGEHFWDLDVTGTGRVALQADFTELQSGLYTYELTSGPLQFDGENFAGTLTTQIKELKIVNTINSPFGAGWGLHGHIEIVENQDGSVLWIEGGGGQLFFPAPETEGSPYINPAGDFSKLVKQADGTFVQTLPNQTVYTFNTANQLASKTDRNGNTWSYNYVDGIIAEISDPTGLSTIFTSTGGRVTSITDPVNRMTLLEYDAAGNLVKITDPDATFKQWSYDTGHRIIAETDKRGFTEQVFYDYAGRATRSLRADGSELLYDPVQTQVLRPISATTSPLNPPSVSDIQRIRSQFVDSNGNVTQRALDKQGQFVAGVDSVGSLGTVSRNSDNRIARRNDARGFTTDVTNDNRGNTTTVVEDILVGSGAPLISLPYDTGNQVAIRPTSSFTFSSLGPNDDGSSGVVDVGFDLNFFGNNDRTVIVNNNGNITFDSALSTFTPFSLLSSQRIIIAPFFADIDTRGVGEVTYGSGRLFGRDAFVVNWFDVGYFSSQTDKTNTFQLVLVDRSDVEPGAFDFEMNYASINWETGSASGGTNGLGGSSARAGYSNGLDVFFELEGSGVNGAFLDNNLVTGLVNQSRTSSIPGRYRFEVRGGEVQRAMRQFEYDEQFSQLTRVVDELGRETLATLDTTSGNVLASIRVIGQRDTAENGETDDLVTQFTYTTFGLIDTMTDPLGRVTDYDYDAVGRLTSVTYAVGTPDEATMRFEYDLAGNQTAMIDGNGNRTVYEYDPLNRLTRTIEADPDGDGPLTSPITTFSYDATGNVQSSTDANGRVSTSVFDDLNRLVQSIGPDPDGDGPRPAPVTTYSYDPVGNLASLTDPNGHTTSYAYDGRNRRIEVTDPDGGVTKFGYDADNNLSLVTDPVGNVTQFRYDARSRLVEEIDPLGNSILYGYDAANNLIQKTDRNGRVTKYSYDDINRLIKEEWVGDNDQIVNTIDYSYDAAGNLQSVADAVSTLAYTYDARNRVKTVDNAGTPDAPNVILVYGYDDNSNVVTVADTIETVAGATTTYQYDALDRLIVLGQSGNEVSDKRVNFTYNALGQYSAIDRYRDLAGAQLVIGTDYNYDGQNRLTRIDHKNAANTSVAFYDYEYDVASRITKITDVDGVTNYAYDDRDQLISAESVDAAFADEFYQYDANGNRIESSLHGTGYETGHANRLLSDGTYDYEHDGEGNLIRRTETESDAYRVFDYDHRNRLVRVTDFSSGGIALQQVDLTYDASGRRIAKTVDVDGAGVGVPTTEHYVYDGEHVILEFVDADGPGSADQPVPVIRNLFGPGIDMILAQQQINTGETRWLLTDHLGTVRDLVSDTGQLLNHLQYDTFGNLLAQSAPAIATRYGFTGREWDASLELNYYRARYYSPELGRFLQQDPIAFAGQDENLYRYVFNQPTTHTDPSGKIVPILVGIWAVAEIGLAIYDTYDTASTIMDPCAGTGDKIFAGGLWVAGAILPGGGYSQLDNVAKGAAKAIAPAKRATGSTVLGHYPEYMQMADSLGHRRFDIPKQAWDKMSDADRWAANQKFLDRTVSRSDNILLSTPLNKVKPGSYYERELQYLGSKGYRPNADGTRLIPEGK